MRRDKLFLDLDGVSVDLVLGMSNHLGKAWPYADPKNLGVWQMSKVFDLPSSKIWPDLSVEFWANLPWTFDGREILELCERKIGRENICILTAPTGFDNCILGKLAWMRREIPYYFERKQYFIGGMKDFMAEPRATLVDDHDENTDAFTLRGGNAALVPRPWNRLHSTCLSALQTLEELL